MLVREPTQTVHDPLLLAYIDRLHRLKRKARWIGTDTWTEHLRSYSEERVAHDFRRTLASSLAMNGVGDAIIDKIMGWAPRSVGRRYYIKVAGPELQRAILRAYADDPI